MNRYDEIQAVARDIASNVHADPETRNTMADDLIKLCGLMIAAVGKGVSVDGECDMNAVDDDDTAFTRYITGERIQSSAGYVVTEAVDADLERYDGPGWTYTDRRPLAVREAGGCTECFRLANLGHVYGCADPDCPARR